VNRASLSFIFFRVLSVSWVPGIRFVEFALFISYFSRIVRTVCFSFVNSFWFLPLFLMMICALFSIWKTLSLSENCDAGRPCVVRCFMVSALAVL